MEREFAMYIANVEKKIDHLVEIINDDEIDEETEEEIEEYLHVLFENHKHAIGYVHEKENEMAAMHAKMIR